MLQFFSQLRVVENIVSIFISESTTRELQEKLWHKVARRTKIGIREKYKIISIFIFSHAQLKKKGYPSFVLMYNRMLGSGYELISHF